MQVMVRFRSVRCLAWMMAVMFAVPYLGSAAVAASAKDTLRQTAVLFPIGNMVMESAENAKAAKAAADLSALLQKGFAGYPKYVTVAYSERLPSVQRMANVEPNGKSLTAGPFAGDPDAMKRAVSVAKAMSADVAVTGTVDFYRFDPAKGEASVTATLQVVDVRTGKSSDTTVTGRASRTADATDATESSLMAAAVSDAGKKMMEQVTGGQYDATQQQTPVVITPSTEKKKSKKSWIPMLLLSLGVGLLLGGGGGGGSSSSGGGPDNPPPIPL